MGGPPRHPGRASGDGGRHPRVDGRRRRRALPGARLPAERQRQLRGVGAPVRVTAEHGGIYAAHQRYAHLGRPVAWRETIELAKASGCPVHVSRARGPGVGRGPGAGGSRGSGPVVRVVPLSCRHDPPGDGAAHPPAPRRLAGHGRAVAAARRARTRGEWLAKYLGRADQFVGYTRSGRHVGQRMAALAAAAGKPVGQFAFDSSWRRRARPRWCFPGRRRGGARTGDRGDRRAPAHDGRQRRRLRRPAPAPAQLRLLRPRAGRVRPRPWAAEPAAGDLQDGGLPGPSASASPTAA